MTPQTFEFNGHNVRFVMLDGKKYAVGKDAAVAIGYKNPQKATRDHVKQKYQRGERIVTPFGKQEMTLISEPGLYQLAAQSKLPNAEPFQDWLFEDVLPSINETGSYSNPQYDDLAKWVAPEPNYGEFADLIPKNMGEALQLAANQQREIDDLKPKADNYEKYHSKAHTWTITQIVSNYGLEAVNVNQYLHSIGVQYKRGNHWYLYRAYKKRGLALQVGSNNIPITYLRWTDKGKEFIENILNSLGYVKNGGLVQQNELF